MDRGSEITITIALTDGRTFVCFPCGPVEGTNRVWALGVRGPVPADAIGLIRLDTWGGTAECFTNECDERGMHSVASWHVHYHDALPPTPPVVPAVHFVVAAWERVFAYCDYREDVFFAFTSESKLAQFPLFAYVGAGMWQHSDTDGGVHDHGPEAVPGDIQFAFSVNPALNANAEAELRGMFAAEMGQLA